MLRRATTKLIRKYVAHYGPDRYGPRGWPAAAEGLDVRGVHTRMRDLLHDAESGAALDWATSAQCLRDAAAVVDADLTESMKQVTAIDDKFGVRFLTADFVHGEEYDAYMRRETELMRVREAWCVRADLGHLAGRFDRRHRLGNLLGRKSRRSTADRSHPLDDNSEN